MKYFVLSSGYAFLIFGRTRKHDTGAEKMRIQFSGIGRSRQTNLVDLDFDYQVTFEIDQIEKLDLHYSKEVYL